jgi:hypothetical protein
MHAMTLKNFITELQQSEPRRKFRWLVGLSVITMAVIFGVLLLVSPSAPTPSGDLVRKDDQPNFFEKIGIGIGDVVATLRQKTANTINFFQQKFSKTNTIEIKPNEPATQPNSYGS